MSAALVKLVLDESLCNIALVRSYHQVLPNIILTCRPSTISEPSSSSIFSLASLSESVPPPRLASSSSAGGRGAAAAPFLEGALAGARPFAAFGAAGREAWAVIPNRCLQESQYYIFWMPILATLKLCMLWSLSASVLLGTLICGSQKPGQMLPSRHGFTCA